MKRRGAAEIRIMKRHIGLPKNERRRLLREKYRHQIKKQTEKFQREFRKQLALFITGAFSFVAALLWNGAINKMINRYQAALIPYFPVKEGYVIDLAVALFVTVIGVIAVITITKILRVNETK